MAYSFECGEGHGGRGRGESKGGRKSRGGGRREGGKRDSEGGRNREKYIYREMFCNIAEVDTRYENKEEQTPPPPPASTPTFE